MNNKITKKLGFRQFIIIPFCLLIVFFSYGQENTLLDFGSQTTGFTSTGNWNNIIISSKNESGLDFNLIDNFGNNTGVILTIDDSFDFVNKVGTTNPDVNLPFIETATKDSFFGESKAFNGNTNPTGGFTLSNLDPSKYYSFSIFASRTGVSDNRETQYTVTGINTESNALDASNNTSKTATILNIQPLSNGTISFVATTGANNTHTKGFYYLGALKIVTSSSPITDVNPTNLTIIYPNGGEVWEVGKTPYISWQSQNISNVTLEYSTNDGDTWTFITTVPANTQKYNWTIPNNTSTECKIRISEGTNTTMSTTNFSIIENVGLKYKIVILGSSTAAGTGPSNINNAWVWRYQDFLSQKDTRYNVENLAKGSLTSYNILPTGTTIPSEVNQTVDIERNVTKALDLKANGIIINLPSNDVASGYPSADQIANYHLIRNTATAKEIPVWISSPQPRNFGSNATALKIQLEMVTATPIEFNEFAFDFWTDLGIAGGNGIKPAYNKDGVHMNAAGHKILFDRVVAKDMHSTVKSIVDATLAIDSDVFNTNFKLYPNPFNKELIININHNFYTNIRICIFDTYGRKIATLIDLETPNNSGFVKWNPMIAGLSKGIYICTITTNNHTFSKKIIFN